MDFLTLIVLIVVGFILYSWLDSSEKQNEKLNEERKAEELRKNAEEEQRKYREEEKKKEEIEKLSAQKNKKELKPMQDRIKNYLKNHIGETFSESELRKRLGITTASEDNVFIAALRSARDDYGWKGSEWAEPIEGVIVSYSDGQHYAYYVDPNK